MTPLNQAERSRAFIIFFIFFIITVAVIVITMLFSFQVPFKENNQLRHEMSAVEIQNAFLADFSRVMQQAMNNLDSVGSSVSPEKFEVEIGNNITALRTKISSIDSTMKDPSLLGTLCTMIVSNISSAKSFKIALGAERKIKEELATKLANKSGQLNAVETQNQQLQSTVDQLRMMNRSR